MATTTTLDPKLIEMGDRPIFEGTSKTLGDKFDTVLDKDWSKSSFLIPDKTFSETFEGEVDKANRYWSSVNAKFTDGRIGCNIGINARPQFTMYSDIRGSAKGVRRNKVSPTSTYGNYGMGRYWSEAIDDPSQVIYMRFGVPQFNSLSNFLRNAFNGNMTSLAKTGRTSWFSNIGEVAGTILGVVAFPMAAAAIATGKTLDWIFSTPTSKFYTLKPTMHTYWSTVNTLLNHITINKGLFPKILSDKNQGQRLGNPYSIDEGHIAALAELMPDVFKEETRYFDVFAIANKAQRQANAKFIKDYEALKSNDSATEFGGYLLKTMTGEGVHDTYISNDKGKATLSSLFNAVSKLTFWFGTDSKENHTEQNPRVPDDTSETEKEQEVPQKEVPSSFIEYFDAEFSGGGQFAAFRVDHTGPIQESFTNAVVDSDLSQKLNSTSSQMRQMKFTFAEGNIIGGAIGEAIGGVVGAVKDTATGLLSGVTLGLSDVVMGVLGGTGFVDIPKHWQSSSANLPRVTYTMQLISPYGNAMSQILNIFIPLSMILAAALPRSTGKQSYTSPFLCQLFDKGRCQTKLGMIESLSISRGTSNLAFNTRGNPLAIDVSFNVVDLSSIMHMPLSSGSFFGSNTAIDEDNILVDYLAVLAGQDIYSQLYPLDKARLRFAKSMIQYGKLTSPAFWSSWGHSLLTDSFLQYLTLGVGHVIEGASRNPDVLGGAKQ